LSPLFRRSQASGGYRDLFDAVQAKLNDHRNNQTVARGKSDALLTGRVYGDRGNRMTPSHVRIGHRERHELLDRPGIGRCGDCSANAVEVPTQGDAMRKSTLGLRNYTARNGVDVKPLSRKIACREWMRHAEHATSRPVKSFLKSMH
jgi:hypothetical protein